MKYDVLIAGGGAAGLTAAAYTARKGLAVALFEKQDELGGLVKSVTRNGFTFDMGLRAVEDSGIILPMFSQLGIPLDYVPSTVSIGIEDTVLSLASKESLNGYGELLESFYPESREDIHRILQVITSIMKDMEVIYGIENPLFKDLKRDYRYIFRTLLPWMFKFIGTIGKINRMNEPVEKFLDKLTDNASLKGVIGQHFFTKTPAFFAMSYFSVYLDYLYPKGGTGTLTKLLAEYVRAQQAEVHTNTALAEVDPLGQTVTDARGETWSYDKLIWCCDLNTLYASIDMHRMPDSPMKESIQHRRHQLEGNRGGESVLSLFLSVDEKPEYFAKISDGHFFYTPDSRGLGNIHAMQLEKLLGQYDATPEESQRVMDYTQEYLKYTTYEISIPVLKDSSMAPAGKTGLIISCVFSYDLLSQVDRAGWYEEYKEMCCKYIIGVFSRSIYPGLSEKILDRFVSTPLSIERLTGNAQGAITGWSFDTDMMPAVHQMQQVSRSVVTPMKHIYQAGQWAYSPSGLPISLLTGKLAADRVIKELT